MKQVNFYSDSLLSELDLTTMGGSEKRGDSSKIGTFCTGLKYAVALFLRHGVEFSVKVFKDGVSVSYSVTSKKVKDTYTGKEKELIAFVKNGEETIISNISVELGFDWKLEYGLREIWSNMIDEKGYFEEGDEIKEKDYGTIITLKFEDGSEFDDVWAKKDVMFLRNVPLVTFTKYSDFVEIRDSEHFRIYKQGILVYEDLEREGSFSYNINFGELDERRVLLNSYSVFYTLARILSSASTEQELDFLLNLKKGFEDFKYQNLETYDISKNLEDKVKELEGNIKTFYFIEKALKKFEDTPLANRKIKSLKDSYFDAVVDVEVEQTVKEIKELPVEVSIENKISSKLSFPLDCSVKKASLRGSVVVADKLNNAILVSEDFDTENEKHLISFIIQMFEVRDEGKGNILDKMAKHILNCK